MGFKNYNRSGANRANKDTGFHLLDKGAIMRKVAEDNILPYGMAKGKEAVGVDRHRFWFYSRKTAGRRCSCFFVEDSPESFCTVCLGKGVVGAYDKHGCHTHVLDVTHSNIRSVNVMPKYALESAPVRFGLLDEYEATRGEITFTVPIQRGAKRVDAFQALYNYKSGESLVELKVKASADPSFVDLTEDSLAARLNNDSLEIRVLLSRASPLSHKPTFSHVFFRLAVMDEEDMLILGDVPRKTESITMQEYGLQGGIQSIPMWMPHQLIFPRTDDLFYDLENGTMWSVVETQDLRPLQRVISWDLQLAFVHDYQTEHRILR